MARRWSMRAVVTGALALALAAPVPAVAAPEPARAQTPTVTAHAAHTAQAERTVRSADDGLVSVPVQGVDRAAARDASALRATVEDASSGPLDPDDLAALGPRRATVPFLVAGVTWDAGQDVEVTQVAVRVREDGAWTGWQELHVVDLDVAGERPGTEPLVSSGADGAQVRVTTRGGEPLTGVRLDVVDAVTTAAPVAGLAADPATDPTPAAEPATDPATTTQAGGGTTSLPDAIRPAIVTRAQWGADESLARPWPEVSSRLRAMYLHHTAGTNSYSRSQAKSVVRGIYAFHTRGRDWPDIGYQLLVDRFGTIYEGRSGATVDLPIGAQAGGYNTGTIGVSAMGNFQKAAPPAAMVASIEKVYAWLAWAHGLDATGTTTLVTGTSSLSGTRAKPGATVKVPVILGHRDTNVTACPGAKLYAKLPAIRKAVKKQVAAATKRYGTPRAPLAAPAPVAPGATQSPVQWSASSTYRWEPVAGAVAYQLLTRSSAFDAATDSRAWTVARTTTGTSGSVSTDDGRTRVVAVRAVDAQGRRGAVATVTQVTRPLAWSQVAIRDGWRASKAGGVLSYGTDGRAAAAMTVSGARQVRSVVLDVVRGPATGRVQVRRGSTVLATLDTRAATQTPRAVLAVTLPSSTTGSISLRTVAGSGPVRINAVALPRVPTTGRSVAVGTLAPAPPTRAALAADQAPVREAVTSTYRWRPAQGATRYDVLVRTAPHGKRLPSTWKKVASTTGTSYTLSTAASGRTWVVGVRAVGPGGPGVVTAFPATTRPVATTSVRRSSGWTVRHADAWYRGMTWQTSAKGRTLAVSKSTDVRRVRLIVDAAPGRGRVQVLVGKKVVRTVSTARSTRRVHQHVDVVLPRRSSGTIRIRTVDTKPVRISAVVLAR